MTREHTLSFTIILLSFPPDSDRQHRRAFGHQTVADAASHTASKAYSLTIAPAALADLTVTSVSIPSSGTAGGPVSISATIKNQKSGRRGGWSFPDEFLPVEQFIHHNGKHQHRLLLSTPHRWLRRWGRSTRRSSLLKQAHAQFNERKRSIEADLARMGDLTKELEAVNTQIEALDKTLGVF